MAKIWDMKRYLILSRDLEYGPYSLEELKCRTIRPTDMIWVADESRKWLYASEIPELQDCIETPASAIEFIKISKTCSKNDCLFTNPPFVSGKNSFDIINSTALSDENAALRQAQPVYRSQTEGKQQNGREGSTRHINSRKTDNIFYALLTFALLMIGYLANGLMEAMDKDIKHEKMILSTPFAIPDAEATHKRYDHQIQNALGREIVMVDTSRNKRTVISSKPFDWRREVVLKRPIHKNNGQEIRIINHSAYPIDHVIVQIQYMKTNGTIIAIEEFRVKHIAPKGQRILQMPPEKSDIRVKYKLLDVQSKAHPGKLIEI